jgi:hypothetical protein
MKIERSALHFRHLMQSRKEIARRRNKMIVTTLCSGLVGALFAQVLSFLWSEHIRQRDGNAVLNGIIAECEYNIAIIDEILMGVVSGGGSFKRLSVDYFKTIQKDTVKYRFHSKILSAVSRLIVDISLFNKECDYVFNGLESDCVYAGVFNGDAVCITKKSNAQDITATVEAARNGVKGSLMALKELAQKIMERKEVEDA